MRRAGGVATHTQPKPVFSLLFLSSLILLSISTRPTDHTLEGSPTSRTLYENQRLVLRISITLNYCEVVSAFPTRIPLGRWS
jgi:hypothetical protein